MDKIIKVRWQSLSEDAIEDLILRETNQAIFVESSITGIGKENLVANYSMVIDATWRVRKVQLELSDGRNVLLTADGNGRWSDEHGHLEKLEGAIDVDISITPFTNRLPIQRLKLGVGESAEISVVYISVPDLMISLDPQRYTCIVANQRYRYESLESDFVREIDVDEDGLVLIYPGLFKRIQG
jgi:hypothetical protein